VSIGAVIRAPTLRAFPLITELSNIPRISDATSETRLSELEEFWDSEMARIGEEGAEGWGKWYASGKRGISASCEVELARLNVVQLDPYCQWSFNETQRDHSSLLPAKSSDQVADIHPFATVLFSDVRLFEMRYLAARLAFQLAWLPFLGLHVPGLSQRMLHRTGMIGGVLAGYLTTQSRLDTIFPTSSDQKAVMTESAADVGVGWEKEYANSSCQRTTGSQFSQAVQMFGFCGTGLRTSLGSSCSIGATA